MTRQDRIDELMADWAKYSESVGCGDPQFIRRIAVFREWVIGKLADLQEPRRDRPDPYYSSQEVRGEELALISSQAVQDSFICTYRLAHGPVIKGTVTLTICGSICESNCVAYRPLVRFARIGNPIIMGPDSHIICPGVIRVAVDYSANTVEAHFRCGYGLASNKIMADYEYDLGWQAA